MVFLKVIQVVSHYYPYSGGINTHTKLLSEGLVREGVKVHVYTTDPKRIYKKKENINGVEINRFPTCPQSDAYIFSKEFFSSLKKVNADIIHAHSIHDSPLLYSAFAKKYNKTPLVSTNYYHGKGHTFFRNLLFQPYRRILGEFILGKTDLLISLSESEKKMIKSDFKTPVKIKVVPACLKIDRKYGYLKKATDSINKKIIFVGRLEKYKGVQFILYALKILSKEIDVKLWVIGEGSYKQELQKITENLGIGKHVIFSQKKGDAVINEYLSSDLVVVPSFYESFNLVAIEALACGVPVLTTPKGEASTLIKEGLCAGLENPCCISEMTQKIKMLLSTNYDKNKFQEISRKIFKRYSPQRIAKETLSAYTTTLDSRARV